jgi:tetratricopeptide (TPR) repeat protein
MIIRRLLFFCYPLILVSGLGACKTDPSNQQNNQIVRLERALATTFNAAQADSLLALYQEAVQKTPDNHAANFDYLIKSADIQFLHKNNGDAAFRSLDAGMTQHGQGQNYTQAMRVCALLWNAFSQKAPAAATIRPDGVVKMNEWLTQNTSWLDSSLTDLDDRMGSPVVNNVSAARQFLAVAEVYASLVQDSNPDKYVDLLLKAAGLAKTIELPEKSLELYQRVVQTQAKHPKAPTALFMSGFVYENDLNDLKKAKAVYEQFLREYPNDPDFADDAKMALQMLGKSPEEIIKRAAQGE